MADLRLRLAKLGHQLHVGSTNPKEATYEPIKNIHCFPKPENGVWTSSYLGKTKGSDWIDYCIRDDFIEAMNTTGWLCTPDQTKKILDIDSQGDLNRIMAAGYRYPCPQWKDGNMDSIDFEKASKDFDGIHLTEEGQCRTRTTMSEPNLYGWDAESTIHFRDNFKSCKKVDLTPFCKATMKAKLESEKEA